MLYRLLFFSSLLLPVSASAQLNKCYLDDKVVYQSQPCPGSPSVDLGQLESDSVQSAKRLKLQKQNELQLLKKYPRKLTLGMSSKQVLKAWGNPDKVNRSVYSGSVDEQWVYHSSNRSRYAYLHNGYLNSYQE